MKDEDRILWTLLRDLERAPTEKQLLKAVNMNPASFDYALSRLIGAGLVQRCTPVDGRSTKRRASAYPAVLYPTLRALSVEFAP